MCWEFCNTGFVTTRKEHKCTYCGRIIPIKSKKIFNWNGKFDGEFQNSYACHWCYEHKEDFDYDEYIGDFWDGLNEIFYDKKRELEKLTEDEHVEIELEGDYLIFEDSEGKEIHREYIPVIIESEDE